MQQVILVIFLSMGHTMDLFAVMEKCHGLSHSVKHTTCSMSMDGIKRNSHVLRYSGTPLCN